MSETAVREKARQDYKEEGCCNNRYDYPEGSMERLWYTSEAQRIQFNDFMGICV